MFRLMTTDDLKAHIAAMRERAGNPDLVDVEAETGLGLKTVRDLFEGKNLKRATTVIGFLEYLRERAEDFGHDETRR